MSTINSRAKPAVVVLSGFTPEQAIRLQRIYPVKDATEAAAIKSGMVISVVSGKWERCASQSAPVQPSIALTDGDDPAVTAAGGLVGIPLSEMGTLFRTGYVDGTPAIGTALMAGTSTKLGYLVAATSTNMVLARVAKAQYSQGTFTTDAGWATATDDSVDPSISGSSNVHDVEAAASGLLAV